MQRGAKVDDKPVPPTSYRVKILFSQLNKVWESQDSSLGNLSFLIILDYPAIYHRKLLDPTSTFTGDCSWRETDTWLRQTRIIHDVRRGVDIATNLRKSGHLIDLGKLVFYSFVLRKFNLTFISQGAGTSSGSHYPPTTST